MKNKTKLPGLIPILVLTLVTVVMWVSLDIYRAVNKPSQSTVPTEISEPLTPTLDQNSMSQIESRSYLDDSQIPDIMINSSPIAKPTIQPTTQPESTSSSQITQ
jgi:hypothetical protein